MPKRPPQLSTQYETNDPDYEPPSEDDTTSWRSPPLKKFRLRRQKRILQCNSPTSDSPIASTSNSSGSRPSKPSYNDVNNKFFHLSTSSDDSETEEENIAQTSEKSHEIKDPLQSEQFTEAQIPPINLSLDRTSSMDEATITRIVQSAIAAAQGATARDPPPPKVDIPKLTMSNYVDWSKKLRYALMLHQLWVDPTKDPATLEADDKAKSSKAVLFLACYLDNQNAVLVNESNDTCFITAWNQIKRFHQPQAATIITDIYSSIQDLQHQPGESIESHLIKMEAQFSRFHEIGEKVSEKHMAAMILTSVRNSSEFKSVFETAIWGEESSLTIAKVKSVLISTQRQHNNFNTFKANSSTSRPPSSSSSAKRPFKSRKKHNRQPRDPVKGWECKDCEMDNHERRFCTRKPTFNNYNRRSSFNRGNKADNDNEVAEMETDENVARAYTVSSKQSSIKSRLGASYSEDLLDLHYNLTDGEEDLLLKSGMTKHNFYRATTDISVPSNPQTNISSRHDTAPCGSHPSPGYSYSIRFSPSSSLNNILNSFRNVKKQNFEIYQALSSNILNYNKSLKSNSHSIWIIDSGATIHMCQSRHLLKSFTPHEGNKITVANGSSIPIKGYGQLEITIKHKGSTYPIVLNKVAFAPDLSVNLISVRLLAIENISINFTARSCFIVKSRCHIPFGIFSSSNSSYNLKIIHPLMNSNNATFTCIHEWHRKMSHRNIDHIQKVKTSLNLKIDPCKCSNECDGCLKGKFHSLPFPKVSERPSAPRDVITSDICGPFRTESLGGARFFATFTCANSGYTEVATLRTKSQCKHELMSFLNKCNTQFGNFPKIVRSDRGGEYMDHQLLAFLKQNGIIFQCSAPRCPEQNGISERKNRTLVEAIRTSLMSRNLPNYLWAEALHHANNTFNAIPKKSEFSSPKEIFFGRSSRYQFIEFGAPVYLLTDPTNRSKLAARGAPGIFVGHDHNSKGFRIFSNGKIIVARHVKILKNPLSDVSEKPVSIDQSNQNPLSDISEESVSIDQSNQNPITIVPDPESVTAIRRSERIRQLRANVSSQTPFEPKTYKQAIACHESDKWILAMQEELCSIEQNKTWTLCDLPKHREAIGCRWVFKLKLDEHGNAVRYKARLVAQGFTQKFGVDYDEVFAPVTRSSTFRTLLMVASARRLIVQQFDVKTAFLNGSLDEEIYMRAPPGSDNSEKVFKLNKSLYGLKQAARVWNQTLSKAMTSAGFTQSKHDECLYVYKSHHDVCYTIVHVDDMIFASNSQNLIDTLTRSLNDSFELKNLGEVKHYLGIQVTRDHENNFSLDQSQYITKIAAAFQLEDSKGSVYPLDPGYHKLEDPHLLENNTEYRKLIGMLLYVSTNTRPDISASIGILAQRVSTPRTLDMTEAKRVVKYLLSTKDIKLHMFNADEPATLKAYADADWAEDRTTRRSISGVICKAFGGPVSWSSRKQGVVSTSTTEAEFYALSEAIHEIQWLQYILKDFHMIANDPITIHSDNQSTIRLIENEKFSSRTKHIDTRLHAVRECVINGKINIEYCPSEFNVADLLTKPLAGVKVGRLRKSAGLY